MKFLIQQYADIWVRDAAGVNPLGYALAYDVDASQQGTERSIQSGADDGVLTGGGISVKVRECDVRAPGLVVVWVGVPWLSLKTPAPER